MTTRKLGRHAAALFVVTAATASPLALGAPNAEADTTRSAQWPIAFLNLPQAWKATKGAGVTVAVLDTGVVGTRADLTGQVTTGQDFAGGYLAPGDPEWGAHGTGMASIIAGHGHGPGNSNGVMGVAPAARILSVRVIRDDESPEQGLQEASVMPISEGIRYAVDNGAQVISMSLGGNISSATDTDSTPEAAAIRYALQHGVPVVVAAGNSGEDSAKDVTGYPAGERGVIAVAAVDSTGRRAPFSSTGWDVSVAAPGVDVPMALPIDDPSNENYADFGTVVDSSTLIGAGTSPACAYVAGVVALIRSAYPKLTPAQISQLVKDTASHRPAGGRSDGIGAGIIDPVAALKTAATLTPDTVGAATAQPYTGPAHFGYDGAIDAAEPGRPLSDSTRGAANAGIALVGVAWLGGWLLLQGRRKARTAASGSGPMGPMSMSWGPAPMPGAWPGEWPMATPVPVPMPDAPNYPMYPMTGLPPSPSCGPTVSPQQMSKSTVVFTPFRAPQAVATAAAQAEPQLEPQPDPATPDEPDKVDTMNQFAGKTIAPSPFPTDDGSADPELIAVLEAHGSGHTELERAYGTLLNARVLAPIVAVLGEGEDIRIADGRTLKSDKNSDMALITLVAPDGTRALPVFTSVASLTAWNADARPMPVAFPRACAAAQAEGATVVLVDLGQSSYLQVEPAAVRAFTKMLEQQEEQQMAAQQEAAAETPAADGA